MKQDTVSTVNISIDVPDLDAGVAFYCGVFGWVEKSRPFPAMAVIDGNNVTICMHGKSQGTKPTPTETTRNYNRHWTPIHLDLHVSDFDSTLTRAVEAGGVVEQQYEEPKQVAICADPFGNGFCIIGP